MIGPIGTVFEAPNAFEWRRNEAIEDYRVTLLDVRGTVLFECRDKVVVSSDGETASCAIPPSVSLKPYVRYSWQVSGLEAATANDQATEVARSPRITFTIEPISLEADQPSMSPERH